MMMIKTFALLTMVGCVLLLAGRPGQGGYTVLNERSLDQISGGEPLTWPQPGDCSYLSLESGEVSEFQCNGASGATCVGCDGGSYNSMGLGTEDTPHVEPSGGQKVCANNDKYKGLCINNLCQKKAISGKCAGTPDAYRFQ